MKKGAGAPVGARILDELFAEAAEVAVVDLREDARVAGRARPVAAAAAQPFREVEDIVQFHGAVHLRVRRQDLLQQRRARARQADDEDGVRSVEPQARLARKELRRADFDLAVHAHLQVFRAVAALRVLQRIAAGVVPERAPVPAAVLPGLAESEADMDPVLLARGLIRLHGGHLRQLFAGKAVRLGIGQAPVRIAVIALEPVRPPVQLDRLPDVAAGLVDVGQRNGKDRIAGESLHQQLVVPDGGIVPAHAAAGGGVQ